MEVSFSAWKKVYTLKLINNSLILASERGLSTISSRYKGLRLSSHTAYGIASNLPKRTNDSGTQTSL
jgi:hypothetical protein